MVIHNLNKACYVTLCMVTQLHLIASHLVLELASGVEHFYHDALK